jgi:hypothetical protein
LFKGITLNEHDNRVLDGEAVDHQGNRIDLKGRRLLWVGGGKDGKLKRDSSGKFTQGKAVIVTLQAPSPADPNIPVTVRWDENPHGVWTMEWSNCLAHVVHALRAQGRTEVECAFTAAPAEKPQPGDAASVTCVLSVQDFFMPGTAVISDELARPGELTQGLCSPWQNDLRECSCYYWASSRPDFVNTRIGDDGLTHGDNWFAKKRTGSYVLDDYDDPRLIGYDDLFKDWEQLQFQIRGRDSAPNLRDPPKVPRRRKS